MNREILPNNNDVLTDSSDESNQHPGNITFRAFVRSKREAFEKASQSQKLLLVKEVYTKVLKSDPPGRFLTKIDGNWCDMSIIQNCVTNTPSIRIHQRNEDNPDNKTHPTQPNKDVDPTYKIHLNKSIDWTPLPHNLDEGKELDGRSFDQSMVDALEALNTSVKQMDISTKQMNTSTKGMDFSGTTLGDEYSIQHSNNNYEKSVRRSCEHPPCGNGKSVISPRFQMETKDQWRTSTALSCTFPPLNSIAPN